MQGDVFWLAYDNPVEWQLTKAGVAIDHTAITRWVLHLDGAASIDIDSSVDANFFTAQADRVVLTPYGAAITPGNYLADLVVYAADYPHGAMWVTARPVKVI